MLQTLILLGWWWEKPNLSLPWFYHFLELGLRPRSPTQARLHEGGQVLLYKEKKEKETAGHEMKNVEHLRHEKGKIQ